MMKLATPKRVMLPNGRTFVARYKRIPRAHLPPNIIMRRHRRRGKKGQGSFDFIKKVSKNPMVKSIAKQGLKYERAAYANLTGRVKSKTLKRILNSDMAHSTLNRTIRAANRRLR